MQPHTAAANGPMSNRRHLRLLVVTVAVLVGALADGCSAQTALSDFVPGRASAAMEQAAPGQEHTAGDLRVHRIDLGPSNAFLLENPDGLYLIDAGVPRAERLVLERMQELGRDDLRLIFITHAHIDHYGAAAALREATGAAIAVHRADAASMRDGNTQLGMVRDWEWTEDTVVPMIEDSLQIEAVVPDILLEDGDSLAEYGLDAYVLHTPGHTPGSSSLIVEGELAFVGDLLSANGKPHAQRMYAADWSQLAASIERLQELDVAWAYSGHGDEPISGESLRTLSVPYTDTPGP